MRLLIFCIVAGFSSCAVSKIYIVRHAEKTGNAPLADLRDPEGFARATALRDSLKNGKLTAVYSTNVPRTRHTAEPAAEANGRSVIIYKNADSLADQLIRQRNKRILVVGHSNTIPQMLRHIGLDPGYGADIPDNDFDNLYVVTIRWKNGQPLKSVVKKTYGTPSP